MSESWFCISKHKIVSTKEENENRKANKKLGERDILLNIHSYLFPRLRKLYLWVGGGGEHCNSNLNPGRASVICNTFYRHLDLILLNNDTFHTRFVRK